MIITDDDVEAACAAYWTDWPRMKNWPKTGPTIRASMRRALEAMRAIEEHGGSLMMERAFEGFMSLPAPSARRPWREVLGPLPAGAPVGAAWVEEKFRILAKKAHPDRGGSAEAMAELNAARAEARTEISRSDGGSVW